jgi:hypothetical protein
MDNTTYEFFICRCWNCKRFEHGANTDTWEDLLIKHYNYKNVSFNKVDSEKQYFKKLTEIREYLDKAFNKLISKTRDKSIIETIKTKQEIVKNSTEPIEIFDTLKSIFPIINENNL